MADFKTVCKVGDLADGEGKTVILGGRLIALFRCGEEYHAIDDTCPHMGVSLSGGYVEDGIVACPRHGWRFRLCDGAWTGNPKIKLDCFAVRVEGDEVRIEIPQPPEGKKP